MKRLLALAAMLSCHSGLVWSQQNDPLEEIHVTGVRQRLEQAGVVTDAIMKTEVIGALAIENKNALNLSEAIANTPGVRVSNECSMCGVKRIMLNGMKGEQTTILMDGLPVHTMISGFYAVDAIATTGIDRIEIARGAGASLIAPEAIGGTINVITREAMENGIELDLAGGELGNEKLGFVGTAVSQDHATGVTIVGQRDVRDQVDEDRNRISEAPYQENVSLIARVSHDVNQHNNVVLRLANISSEIFGGPMLGERFADGKAASIGAVLNGFDNLADDDFALFVGGDVRNNYIGKAWQSSEWIKTLRDEISLNWLSELNSNWNVTLSASSAEHKQDSFYEGFDYYAEDQMNYLDVRFNVVASSTHLITFGIDNRNEEMRSDSRVGESNPDYVADSFDYNVSGLYIQDTWQASDKFELAFALRSDQIEADFVDPNKPGVEIDESIVSPRLDMRYLHNDQWTSRFSAGRGYRAPLSFFETDHGILDGELGFVIDVDELERSNSFTYALSYSGNNLTLTTSLASTEVENLAALDETPTGVPLLTQLDEDATVTTADIALGFQPIDNLTFNLTFENFDYDAAFKSSYAIAPIEQRVTFNADWDVAGWDLFTNLVWIGSRELTDYGIEGYNAADVAGVVASSLKATNVPAYWTLDLKISKELTENFSIYIGANNVLDYTQAADEDSPLFYDADAGYDVAYIYGPLRGREAYLGLKTSF